MNIRPTTVTPIIPFPGRRTRSSTAVTRCSHQRPRRATLPAASGTYKYYNMDQVVAQALKLYTKLVFCGTCPAPTCLWLAASNCGAESNARSTASERTISIRSKPPGHDTRPADLDRIAELGIRTLRYPVLWERYFLRVHPFLIGRSPTRA